MASMRGRGRGSGDMGNARRGSWRGGPPGSGGFGGQRTGSPGGGQPTAPTGPRQSLNEHADQTKKAPPPGSAPSKAFRTDSDISASASQGHRELKAWSSGGSGVPGMPNGGGRQHSQNGSNKDMDTFGPQTGSTKAWDQFETNARLFGTTSTYQEELYTTKLDKSGADYKKREKEADRLAAEIMNQTSSNAHIQEERNQASADGKDEEEKYSGVVRAINAYVPPGARKSIGGASPNAPPPAVPASDAAAPVPTAPDAAKEGTMTLAAGAAPTRSNSDVAPATTAAADKGPSKAVTPTPEPSAKLPAVSPKPDSAAVPENKDAKPGVLDSFRQFVGIEREKVEAKKQSMAKSEREKHLAELKKFHSNFKVPLPMPKDILPILSKDEEKQKAIEAHAAEDLATAKAAAEARRLSASKAAAQPAIAPKATPAPAPSKKIAMSIPEIPPFNPAKRKPPTLNVPETANKDIPLAATGGEGEAAGSTASAAQPAATAAPPAAAPQGDDTAQTSAKPGPATKLNPKAGAFVFKPSAAAFKPGQSSTSSPAVKQAQLSTPAAGPSTPAVPKNPFFRDQPIHRIQVNPKEDFNPWRHNGGQVPAASAVPIQWPYTGRPSQFAFAGVPGIPPGMAPMGYPPGAAPFDDDPSSPHARPMALAQGYPPGAGGMPYPPYNFRMSGMSGMPPMQNPAMFSPPTGYAQLPGGMPGGPPPNNVPMYYANGGMQQGPPYMSPPHMQFNPNGGPQRPGGPAGPMNGPGMYYSPNQMTPHQTPQMQQNMAFPPPPPPGQPPSFHQSPMQQPGQIPPFDGPSPPPQQGGGQGPRRGSQQQPPAATASS